MTSSWRSTLLQEARGRGGEVVQASDGVANDHITWISVRAFVSPAGLDRAASPGSTAGSAAVLNGPVSPAGRARTAPFRVRHPATPSSPSPLPPTANEKMSPAADADDADGG